MKRLTAIIVAAAGIAAPTGAEPGATADSLPDRYFDLNEVVITGVRVPKLLKNSPVPTRLISEKDIRRTDATDIEDLLRQELPGVEFSYAMNQQVHLNFNGLGGQSVLFLVDGERLAGETMDDVDFSRLYMANVERIEIVKGASSALYGSNAGGGVINIITRRAAEKWRVTAGARIGRHNEQRYNLTASTRLGRWQNVLTGQRYSIDNYDVHSAPDPLARVVTTIYGNTAWNVSDRLSYRPIDNLHLTARAGFFFRQLTRTDDAPERYRDFSGGMRADWGISAADKLEVAYAFDQYDKSDFYRISGLDVRSYSNVQHSVRALYTHYQTAGHTFTAGADFMRDYMMNRKLSDARKHRYSFDVFAQYDRIISDKWEVVGALRFDYFTPGSTRRLTPKISVRYRPLRNLNIRAAYGMGFRAPTLKEMYYQFDMAGIWIVNGNPDLKPESSHNINISADYTFRNYNVTVTGYFNSIHNRIATGVPYYGTDDPSQLYLDYINVRRYSVGGAEISLRARWTSGLSANLNYAFTDERTPRDRNGNKLNNQYLPARRHSMTARLDWEKSFGRHYSLTASLSGRVLSGVKNVEYKDYYDMSAGSVEVLYPPYTLWKISATQSFGSHVRLSLALDNIFNYKPKYYYLNSPLTAGATFTAGISVDLF